MTYWYGAQGTVVNVKIIKITSLLNIGPADIFNCLKVKIGDHVKRGDVIARGGGLFGFFKRRIKMKIYRPSATIRRFIRIPAIVAIGTAELYPRGW